MQAQLLSTQNKRFLPVLVHKRKPTWVAAPVNKTSTLLSRGYRQQVPLWGECWKIKPRWALSVYQRHGPTRCTYTIDSKNSASQRSVCAHKSSILQFLCTTITPQLSLSQKTKQKNKQTVGSLCTRVFFPLSTDSIYKGLPRLYLVKDQRYIIWFLLFSLQQEPHHDRHAGYFFSLIKILLAVSFFSPLMNIYSQVHILHKLHGRVKSYNCSLCYLNKCCLEKYHKCGILKWIILMNEYLWIPYLYSHCVL